MDSNLPAVIGETPVETMKHAGEVANACKQIVVATAQTIQGHRYVRVEGWQAIAIAHGCVASSLDVERTDSGYRAIGEIRRRDTGTVIATAEGFVGDDESMWAKRPEFARRAMAQTRAISRVCRSAFAHIVVMLNAGLESTPAEEMEAAVAYEPAVPAASRQTGAFISEPQRKRLYAIYKNAGHDDEDVRHWLGVLYGIEHSKNVRVADYEAICKRLTDKTTLAADIAPKEAEGEWSEPGAEG